MLILCQIDLLAILLPAHESSRSAFTSSVTRVVACPNLKPPVSLFCNFERPGDQIDDVFDDERVRIQMRWVNLLEEILKLGVS